MPSHPTYEGPCKVRVLAPGVHGDTEKSESNKNAGLYHPAQHETVREAGTRTGTPPSRMYHLLRTGKILGVVWHGRRAYIPKDWAPTEFERTGKR